MNMGRKFNFDFFVKLRVRVVVRNGGVPKTIKNQPTRFGPRIKTAKRPFLEFEKILENPRKS